MSQEKRKFIDKWADEVDRIDPKERENTDYWWGYIAGLSFALVDLHQSIEDGDDGI